MDKNIFFLFLFIDILLLEYGKTSIEKLKRFSYDLNVTRRPL